MLSYGKFCLIDKHVVHVFEKILINCGMKSLCIVISSSDLEKLILSYDKNKEILGERKITEQEAMELREQFVSDFPADKILNIQIDNYVQGKRVANIDEPNRKTFCYRLEFGLLGFGNIGGANAIKFGVFYSSSNKKYVFKEDKFESPEEAYKEILTQIDMLVKSGKQFTEDNDWKKLSDVYEKLDGIKSVVKSKILSIYYPDKIVLINSQNGIEEILKSIFHIPEEEIKDGIILKKAKLWELKESHPIMKNWSNFDYSYFVWYAWKNSLNQYNMPKSDRRNEVNSTLKLSTQTLPEIINDFRAWLSNDVAQNHIKAIENEKNEVKALMQKLGTMDKNSNEFVDLVLYGLLPNSKTKYAQRVSTFPVFMNIKSFFKNYNYSQEDWSTLANMIYSLAKKFQVAPDKLENWINEFTSDSVHSRSIQCGTISPILFCINDKFPIVNNRIINTYNEFSSIYNWNDIMSKKLDNYLTNVDKCRRLISFLSIPEINDFTIFDLFCYWYDYLYERKAQDDEEDETQYVSGEKIRIPEINVFTLLNIFEAKNFDQQYHSLRNPERIKINQIILNSEKGSWVLPNFQRYFEWKKKDVKEFLESIVKDYYVGALLFWEVSKEQPQLDIMPIKGVSLNKEAGRENLIILDGQQRITSLYYAIKAPNFNLESSKVPLYFYINFSAFLNKDGKEELIEVLSQRLEQEDSYKRLLFPFYELETYPNWVYGLEDFMLSIDSNNVDKVRQISRIILNKLRHIIDGFEIPYISLPESMELVQITDIFERINTMGKKLNAFDLLVARLSLHDIELKKLWEETIKRYPRFEEYDRINEKMAIYILQAISLYHDKTSACNREDILNIYQNIFEPTGMSFEETWHEMADYLNRAISKLENLRDGFGVKDETQIPFSPMIPLIGTLLKEIDKLTNKVECHTKLSIWYWSSVFSNAYSGAVDSQLTSDFKEMRDWFSDDSKIPRTVERARREMGTLILRKVQARGSAMFKGILSLYALKGSNDFDTGQVLENASKNDRDHIFPRSRFSSEENVNSVLNMSWMSEGTNRKIKRYEKPSEYVPKFISEKYKGNEEQFLNVLKSHYINRKAYDYMLSDDFERFISEREQIMLSKIMHLIGVKEEEDSQKASLISPDKPFTNIVIMRNTIRSCEDYIYWIDKYFSNMGLELLGESFNRSKVKNIKILTGIPTTNFRLRSSFVRFRDEMKQSGVNCELRVMTDKSLSSKIHDRWIISRNGNYNLPSPDVVSRGQYSEVKNTENTIPFEKFWTDSLDIIRDWNTIDKFIHEYQRKT